MKYLNYSGTDAIAERFYSHKDRRAGVTHCQNTLYYDIIRFFGTNPVDPGTIPVEIEPGEFVLDDPKIVPLATRAADLMTAEGRIYDGPRVTHLSCVDPESSQPTVKVQPCDYRHHAGTCLSLDLEHPDQSPSTLRELLTARDYWGRDGVLLPACLGVCGFVVAVIDSQPHALVVRRSAKLATMRGLWSPTVAGMVDWRDNFTTLDEMITTTMAIEVEEELGLERSQFELAPLALAREIPRGERPQAFFLIRVDLGPEEFSNTLRARPEQVSEFDQIVWCPLDDLLDGRDGAVTLSFEGMMGALLIEEYLDR